MTISIPVPEPPAIAPVVVAPAHPVEGVVTAVTEPVADAAEAVQTATDEKLDRLIALAEIHNEHLVRSHEATERVLGHLGGLANSLTETSGHIAQAAANVAGESAQTVLAVPEVPAEAVDAAVEAVEPEKAKPKQKSRKDVLKRKR